MKIISYNVNGIRAAIKKGLIDWLQSENPDVLCLQELKATEDKIDKKLFEDLGYHGYYMPAVKPGYSGVSIFTKQKPINVVYGCGIEKYDFEGRVIRVDYALFSVICVYMPSGTSGEERQAFKIEWLKDFYTFIQDLTKKMPNLVVCGDYNIAHTEIDIHNPVSNKKSSGFLPEERQWLTQFLELGFLDTFRVFNKEPHRYSWWTYRSGARKKNKGWRLDYLFASEKLKSKFINADILDKVEHSDHCPILLEINEN